MLDAGDREEESGANREEHAAREDGGKAFWKGLA
jgi:hypothetical protein